MRYENFDLNISKHIKKLTELADKRFPKRTWFIQISLWQDSDFRITLNSGWGKTQDRFVFRKSDNQYKYQKIGFEKHEVILTEEDLHE